MKKMFIIIICLLLIVGCSNDKDINNEPVQEETLLTKEEINEKLYTYAIEMYESKKYLDTEKVDGYYKISLKDLQDKFSYDISMFVSPISKKKCDYEKTAVVIDIDNVRKVNYKEYPIMIEVYCD